MYTSIVSIHLTVIQHSELLSFSDDIKLFLRIDTTDDCKLLQHDLDAVSLLGLELSIPKCHTMVNDLHSFQ